MQSVPELARQLHNDAVVLARAGRYTDACDKLRMAISTAGLAEVDPRTLKALWQIAWTDGDWPTALAAGIKGASPSHEETKREGMKAAGHMRKLLTRFFKDMK